MSAYSTLLLVAGVLIAAGMWIPLVGREVATVVCVSLFIACICSAVGLHALQQRWAGWKIDIDRKHVTVWSGFTRRTGRSRTLDLLPGTRAELLVMPFEREGTKYTIAITSPLQRIVFGDTLSLIEQFWVVKALNRILRVTSAGGVDSPSHSFNNFEISPDELPLESPLKVAESTPVRLLVQIYLIPNAVVRRAFRWAIFAGMLVMLLLLIQYRDLRLITSENGFVILLIGIGLMLFGTVAHWRTEVQVTDVLRCRSGIGPFMFAQSIPVQSIGFIGIVRLRGPTDDQGDTQTTIIVDKPRVRRPEVERVTCAVGKSPKQIEIQLGSGFDTSAQLAAVLRHRLRTQDREVS